MSVARTWRYVKAEGEFSQYYFSNDGYQIVKIEEDWPHKDFYWQVYRPEDTCDTVNHNEAYCTASAAKASLPDCESDILRQLEREW